MLVTVEREIGRLETNCAKSVRKISMVVERRRVITLVRLCLPFPDCRFATATLTGLTAMPIEFRCQQCNKLLRTPDESAGKKGKCPHCGALMDVPTASTEPQPKDPFAGIGGTSNDDDLFGKPPEPPAEQPAPYGDAPGPFAPSPPGYGPAPAYQQPFPQTPGGYGAAPNPYSAPAASAPAYGQQPYGYATGRPHRGGMILTFGILSLVGGLGALASTPFCICCDVLNALLMGPAALIGLGFGIPGWLIGNSDLKAMFAGTTNRSGQGSAKTGRGLSIAGVALSVVSLVLGLIVIILKFVGFLALNASQVQ